MADADEEVEEAAGDENLARLAPRRFFDPWPTGPVSAPADFAEVPFVKPVKRERWLQSLVVLQELVLDYRAYTGQHKRAKVVTDTGLSINALSSISSGRRFPDFETYRILREYLPPRDRVSDLEKVRREAIQNHMWNLKETQRRFRREVELRLEKELLKHGIKYRPNLD